MQKRILSRCVSQSKRVASDDKRLNNILGLHWYHFTLLYVWYGRSYQPFNQNFAKSSSEIAQFLNVTRKLILTVTCTIEELRMLSFDLQSIAIRFCFIVSPSKKQFILEKSHRLRASLQVVCRTVWRSIVKCQSIWRLLTLQAGSPYVFLNIYMYNTCVLYVMFKKRAGVFYRV